MRKIKKTIIALTFLLGLTCMGGLAACKKNNGGNTSSVEQTATLSLDVTKKSLLYGETLGLVPKYTPQAGETLVWSTSNSAVAVVNDGVVETVGEGTAIITVTYGDLSASCEVSVSFGNLQPVLNLANIYGDELRLGKNSAYTMDASVSFNNRVYPCDVSVEVEDDSVVKYENGELKAIGTGETSIMVQGVWNNVTGALMQKTLSVTVFNDVVITSKITTGSETMVADSVDLYIVDEWQGNTYITTADLDVIVSENGEAKTADISVTGGAEFIQYADGKITAISEGKAILHATYIDSDDKMFEKFITVNVCCPVAEYVNAMDFCTANAFDIATIFGADANITLAQQGDVALTVNDGKLLGFTANGDNTTDLLIHTDKGGYLFTNLYAYDKVITKDNFAQTFKLSGEQTAPIAGYYVLGGDVALGEVEQFSSGNKTRCFGGVFDGRGHKLSATVGEYGLFGWLGNNSVIKNTHFEFTFPEGAPACGLANNAGIFNDATIYTTLENLYVTTTNYTPTSYALTYFKISHTIMKDVYVNLTGVGAYNGIADGYAALFNYDASINNGAYGSFEGEMQSVYVVTGRFIPMANGITPWNTAVSFVTYAKNDLGHLGLIKHSNPSKDIVHYCTIFNTNLTTAPESAHFGTNTYIYAAKTTVINGGVVRYNTVAELKSAGVSEVGTWTIA